MTSPNGIVHLVGAGPGDAGLITVRGLEALREAQVVIFDRLVDRRLLAQAPPDAERIDVGKKPGDAPVSQDQINALIIDRAQQGLRVVRLKGGDPFIFGRGFEELTACRETGVPCIVIPGVSSAVAAPELAGIPLTLRGVSRSFAVLTAETAPDTIAAVDFSQIGGVDTLVILMGRSRLAEIAQTLIRAGWSGQTPVACIEQASTENQKSIIGTLETIASLAKQAELAAPMVTVIGEVARHHTPLPLGEGQGEGQTTSSKYEIRGSKTTATGAGPLAGKRILITRPRPSAKKLAARLEAFGAIPLVCPLLQIRIPRENPALDAAIGRLDEYKWTAFTSAHAVTAFWRRLAACGFDARRMADCKIAAPGFTTAKALRRFGLSPDVTGHSAEALADGILAQSAGAPGCVLWPRGNRALGTLCERLGGAGWIVDDPIAYHVQPVQAAHSTIAKLRDGVDAALLYSPSAAAQLAALELSPDAAIICVGRSTAAAARAAGLRVEGVAAEPTDEGVIAQLQAFLSGEVPAL